MLYRNVSKISMKKGISYLDITERIEEIVKKSRLNHGLCNIFVNSESSGLMITNPQKLLLEDFKNHFRKIDENKLYSYPKNAFVSLRSSMLPNDINVPVTKGSLNINEKLFLWEFGYAGEKEVTVTISF